MVSGMSFVVSRFLTCLFLILIYFFPVQGDCDMLAKVDVLYHSSEDLSETLTLSSFHSLENASGVLNSSFESDTLSPAKKRFRSD